MSSCRADMLSWMSHTIFQNPRWVILNISKYLYALGVKFHPATVSVNGSSQGWCRHHGRSAEKVMAVSKCYAHTRKYTNTQMHKYTNMAVSKYYAHSRKYTNAQIHEYTNTRIHTFTNVVLSNKFKFNRKKYICNLPNKYACQYLKQIYL